MSNTPFRAGTGSRRRVRSFEIHTGTAECLEVTTFGENLPAEFSLIRGIGFGGCGTRTFLFIWYRRRRQLLKHHHQRNSFAVVNSESWVKPHAAVITGGSRHEPRSSPALRRSSTASFATGNWSILKLDHVLKMERLHCQRRFAINLIDPPAPDLPNPGCLCPTSP